MTTFNAFDSILSEIFGDLAETFEEYRSISKARNLLIGLISMNEETDVPMKTFIDVFSLHQDLLMDKDKKLFDVCSIPMVSKLDFNISGEWGSLEKDNKEAIWGYLHELYATGSSILGLDAKLIPSIRWVAQECIEKVASGEMTEEQANNPMVIVQEIMKNKKLMEAYGSPDFGGSVNRMELMQSLMSNPDVMRSLGQQ